LCFNLCPSFPALFDAVDRNGGDVRALTAAEKERVIDLCYGCKLCEIKCPYTPHDGHEFQLDFPRAWRRAARSPGCSHRRSPRTCASDHATPMQKRERRIRDSGFGVRR
jgi:Fe-S oxidoreductase